MRLFVTIPNGRKLTLDAAGDALVSDLKDKIFAALPTAEPAMQTIGMNGRPLGADDRTLQECGVHQDTDLTLGVQRPVSTHEVHDGEHEVTVTTDIAGDAVTVSVLNLHTGDSFEAGPLRAEEINALVPAGFPGGATTPVGFCAFLLAAFAVEAGTGEADASRATLSCSSHEEAGKAFVADIALTFGSGFLALPLPIKLMVPLKTQATPETKYQIGLRSLRSDFQAKVDGLQRQLDLMKLQMNQRVFFGVNHSVHIACTKLVMAVSRSEKIKTVASTGTLVNGLQAKYGNHNVAGDVAGISVRRGYGCGCSNDCNHYNTCVATADFKLQLHDVPSAAAVQKLAEHLFDDDTEYIMPLPSAALLPLQLCQALESLTVYGPQITDVEFINELPKLIELSLDKCQIRNLIPLSTLPSLVCLYSRPLLQPFRHARASPFASTSCARTVIAADVCLWGVFDRAEKAEHHQPQSRGRRRDRPLATQLHRHP
eukprot:COSAG02_NODE_8765_length_2452_cov_1.354866_1_plen_485_part_01